MALPEFETLEDAKQYLREKWEKGATCPCCGQYVKLYKRKLNSGMAYGLIQAYKITQGDSYYHINQLLAKGVASSQLEMPRLAYWGMVEQKPNENDPDKKHSGFWRITQKGRDFVEGRAKAKKHVYVFNGEARGFSGEVTDIKEALGNKFSYNELMANVTER